MTPQALAADPRWQQFIDAKGEFFGAGQFGIQRAARTATPSVALVRSCIESPLTAAGMITSESVTLSATAVPFETPTFYPDESGAQTVFKPGCFRRALASGKDIPVTFNFSSAHVLGRTRVGTARVFESETGLQFEVYPPDTVWMNDLLVSIERSDITGAACAAFLRSSRIEMRGDQRVRVVTDAAPIMLAVSSFSSFDPAGITVQKPSGAAADYTGKFRYEMNSHTRGNQ